MTSPDTDYGAPDTKAPVDNPFINPDAVVPDDAPVPDAVLPQAERRFAGKIDQLQDILSGLSPKERERAAQMGMVVPDGDVRPALAGRFKWGVRCTDCNQMALVFVGDKWKWGNETIDYPPGLPHNQISWMQPLLQPHEIDRQTPRCQHCRRDIPLNSDGSFNRDRKRIVQVAKFEASRDKSYSRSERDRLRERVNTGLADGALAEGYSANYNTKDRPVSETIEESRPGALADIEHVAERGGLNEFVESLKK